VRKLFQSVLDMITTQYCAIIADFYVPMEVPLHPGNNNPQIHEIKIIYHPASERAEKYIHVDEDLPGAPAVDEPGQPTAEKPWHPFRSRLDFEIAELALNAHLSKADTEHLLSIIQRCIQNPEQFTLQGHKDIAEYWDLARSMANGISKQFQFPLTFPTV